MGSVQIDELTLNTFLRELKFVVLADAKSRNPIAIYFNFQLPSMHEDIFLDAVEKYKLQGQNICVQGGGKITKREKHIVFHGRSQKYGRYEDRVVLSLACGHPYFKDKNFVLLSKAGRDDVNEIINEFSKLK
ncbi:MAG: hypothetical protein WCL06_15810 [Bacteroidota bacterium]